MAQKQNPLLERKQLIESSISSLLKSFGQIEKQIAIWQDIANNWQDSDIVREKFRNWESSDQTRIISMNELQKTITDPKLIGRFPKTSYVWAPDSDQKEDYEKRIFSEEEKIRERNLAFLSIKPSRLISIYLNPIMREEVFKQKLEFLVNTNHNYMIYYPRDKAGETTKICTILHVATMSICNMTLELLPSKPNSGQPNQLILTNLSFHMLLEPLASQSTPEKLEPSFIPTNYHTLKKNKHPGDILEKVLGSRDINIEFRQTSSTLDMYNVMSKLVRNKYKSAGSTGTANLSVLMERVIQYTDRYLNYLPKMTCTKCDRGVLFDPKINNFAYPFFNNGDAFFHQSCASEDVVNCFM